MQRFCRSSDSQAQGGAEAVVTLSPEVLMIEALNLPAPLTFVLSSLSSNLRPPRVACASRPLRPSPSMAPIVPYEHTLKLEARKLMLLGGIHNLAWQPPASTPTSFELQVFMHGTCALRHSTCCCPQAEVSCSSFGKNAGL